MIVIHAEHGKPVLLPSRVAWLQGQVTVMRVEDRGESEGLTVMVRIRVATLPDVKTGRLPLGFRSRENLANRANRISR